MTREQLEHLLRAAGSIAGQRRILVIGSQSILGAVPDAPVALRYSMEADLAPLDRPDMADLIDGTIGEGSMFHDTFGYYAQGVDLTSAKLPTGWQGRLVPVSTAGARDVVGLCLDPVDLIVSKYAAGREKDYEFIRETFRNRLVSAEAVLERIDSLPDHSREALDTMKVKVRRDSTMA